MTLYAFIAQTYLVLALIGIGLAACGLALLLVRELCQYAPTWRMDR